MGLTPFCSQSMNCSFSHVLWLKSWMKIVESKDVIRITKVFIKELSSAQTILIASHI